MLNCTLLKEWRQEHKLSVREISERLNISWGYYNAIERGAKEPSLCLLKQIHVLTHLSFANLLAFVGEEPPWAEKDAVALSQELKQLRAAFINAQESLLKKEQIIDHMVTFLSLQKKVQPLFQLKLKSECDSQVVEIIRESQKSGCSNSMICDALRIDLTTLKQWLGQELFTYNCPQNLKDPVAANDQEEAGILFQCFDCQFRSSRDCLGYGESRSPDDIFELLKEMRRIGIAKRGDLVKVLAALNINVTPRTLKEYEYRQRKGKAVPEKFAYMEEVGQKPGKE